MSKEKTNITGTQQIFDGSFNSGTSSVPQVNKRNTKKKKKLIKKIVIWSIIIIIAVIFLLFKFGFVGKNASQTNSGNTYTTFTVARRDVLNILSGTGTLTPYDSYTVSALSSGEILEDYFEEGDEVTEDQLLMKIDSSNLESSLERAENSYKDALDSLNDLMESKEDLKIKSEFSGTIQVMDIEIGDEIRQGTVIASVIDRENMLIDIPFMQEDTFDINKGDIVFLTTADTLESLTGYVDKISPVYTINSIGVKVVNVTIAVKNPGAMTESTMATAKIKNYSCTNGSNFYYKTNESIVSKVSGEVVDVYKFEGDYVNEDDVIIKLDSSDIDKSIEKAERNVKNALSSLDDAKEAFDNYEITAPISGTVVVKNYKKGEKIGNGSGGGNTVAEIYDLSALKFDMNIDELDIADLKLGQDVSITSDAKEGYTYTGNITKISVQGSTQNGTTYYPITVTLENYGKGTDGELRPGMNIDAEIILEKAENALVVPVEAVGRGNRVKVLKTSESPNSDGSSENLSAEKPEGMPTEFKKPDGAPENFPANNRNNTKKSYSTVSKYAEYTEVIVETGISDNDYIVILSGLKEGDVVIVDNANGTPAGTNYMSSMMGGGGMSMGGGMPMGGGMSMGGGMPGRR